MFSVSCQCCGSSATDNGANGSDPFVSWQVLVATSATPASPTDPRAPKRLPAAATQLCPGCRADLVSGGFTSLASKNAPIAAAVAKAAAAATPAPATPDPATPSV